MAEHLSQFPALDGAAFRTTQWSMVINASSDDSLVAVEALDQLCQRHWYPLYASVRRSGYSHADAADLTQSFFARVLERKRFGELIRSEIAETIRDEEDVEDEMRHLITALGS